jgi:hypothetical protein
MIFLLSLTVLTMFHEFSAAKLKIAKIAATEVPIVFPFL